jgi:TPR repeat protein
MTPLFVSLGVAALMLAPLPPPAVAAPVGGTMAVESALALLRERAGAGDAQAQYNLAVALLCGTQVARDPAAASQWLALAAAQNHTGARSVLGWMYMTGTGVQRDSAKAAHWLLQAAKAGDTAAANNLGILYALGQGVAQDDAQAEHWFNVAAGQGAVDAVRNLEVLRAFPGGSGKPPEPVTNTLHPALMPANCRL